jgi:triacylglycerol lipase
MLHGIWKSGAAFAAMEKFLRARGAATRAMDLVPNDGSAPLERLGESVAREVERAWPDGAPIDLVAFSMGGLVARHYLQRLDGVARVRRFVSIGSPHHGTYTAHASRLAGSAQMRPKSAFLADLARDVDRLGAIDVTSIWTPLDLMIVPARSSRLPIGHEVLVASPYHAMLLWDPRSLRAVDDALTAPLGSRASASAPANRVVT